MSYVDELRKSRNKPQVAFQEFSLSTRKLPEHLFCFFEGKDNAYYVPRIKRYTLNYHTIKCGGREKVLKVYELITGKSEYNRYKKAFFIDRDFNPPTSLPIFETPCYSVENLYVSPAVFAEILKNELHLSPVSDEVSFELCLGRYEKLQNQFHEAILLFSAWYACLIDRKNKTGVSTEANLTDKPPRGFIEIILDKVSASYTLEEIKTKFPNAPEITEGDIEQKKAEWENKELHQILRGKYELYFLLEYLRLLIKDAKGEQTFLKEKIKFAFGDASGINNTQALNIFEGYAETPQRLLDYLSTHVTQTKETTPITACTSLYRRSDSKLEK